MRATIKQALLFIAGLSAVAPAVQAADFIVGSKNFTEQYILAEIYASALEQAGIPVQRKINLGGTLIAHAALLKGDIDMYPEYTGTALSAVVKGELSSDADNVYQQVKSTYAEKYQLAWLAPAKLNNGYALLVSKATAEKYQLKTLSDLAKAAPQLTIGAGAEFGDRQDGLKGLEQVYGIKFKSFRQFAKVGLRYDALAAGQIDVANGFATDWQIAEGQYVPLTDDRHLFPPYFVAPVVREQALKAQPQAEAVLNKVSALLDNATMQRLNAAVEKDKEEPADVAQAFLREKGIIKS
ncbi:MULTISPECIES: glycine betaine ABC transporter substrate-binding protein [unclassified Brenneria]|uniref:glycine betaine ABC transporter substrate-binding protein n=1 Tax=unclassified Brenneria TaxID=2634434 RepID=UPI0029C440D3|nr:MULTISPECIES: glycine betaine ABC transporter substrate-binding protein [unclassified Brenneria]MDX5629387.1 glycine betaine ABC transporter substrate-binding protein [Brenneria sp. L3-3Z]MDX5696450.1 glycine betaine ABC transporter substrate-binding protein [Brenneria sp. L4-2C]MEE3663018.1 glycine betaine ABC transporter substrate-binding protein [Brenneria sp. g21c3]